MSVSRTETEMAAIRERAEDLTRSLWGEPTRAEQSGLDVLALLADHAALSVALEASRQEAAKWSDLAGRDIVVALARRDRLAEKLADTETEKIERGTEILRLQSELEAARQELHDEKWQHSQVARGYETLVETHKNEILRAQAAESELEAARQEQQTAYDALEDTAAAFNLAKQLLDDRNGELAGLRETVGALSSDDPAILSYARSILEAPDEWTPSYTRSELLPMARAYFVLARLRGSQETT